MTASSMLPAMDINHPNPEHESQYYISKLRFPTDQSNDPFELFICPYTSFHKITSKRWRTHLSKCSKNYGGSYKSCSFNASHRIPEPEYEYHMSVCNDRFVIAKDVNKGAEWKMATKVDHYSDRHVVSEDNWEDEIDENQPAFELNPDKGMPLSLLPNTPPSTFNDNANEIEAPDESDFKNDDILESVLMEELLLEKPDGWNDWTKAKKKNHKRKYDKQQLRMKKENVTEEDFAPITDPTKWTEADREAKINAIKAAYPLASEKMFAERVDYTSLLQIVCQKVRWNLPEYVECSSSQGGFACRCRVGLKWFESKEFCSTKKDAKHNAAKWALLELEIPGLADISGRRAGILSKTEADKLREYNEVGKLMLPGGFPASKNVALLHQPQVAKQESHIQQGMVQQEKYQPQFLQQPKIEPQILQPEQVIKSQQQTWSGLMQSPRQSSVSQNQFEPSQLQSEFLTKATQSISIADEEFPSLEGGEGAWKTVQKKPIGVGLPMSRGKLHGRGRGTTLKPS